MTDEAKALVERLRMAARDDDEAWARKRWDQAATLIETQAREIERLRGVLKNIMDLPGEINPSNYDHVDVCELNRQFCLTYEIARAALGDSHDNTIKCGTECPYSHDGFHHVDTSMESGPNNCFHCERPMP